MALRMEHEEVMELAVQLACSYLSSSSSGSTNAEDLILDYYRQLRSVEARLESALRSAGEEEAGEEEEELETAAAA